MFEEIFEFERALAKFTGAPYAVMTDCCTHAIELAMRYDQVRTCKCTAYTYISIPQLMVKLDIDYELIDETWLGEYQFHGTRIWDSARRLESNMYRARQIQCLSFGFGKPIDVNRGGAILLDDRETWEALSQMRSDGRDLRIAPWESQRVMNLGFHYRPTIEEARRAHTALEQYELAPQLPRAVNYPDCRNVFIKS